jgi:hypothetical protein
MPVKIHPGLKPGDVIARGNARVPRPGVIDDDCTFDFGIEISLVSGSRMVGLIRGPDCTVLLERIEDRNVIEYDPPPKMLAARRGASGLVARLLSLFEPIWNTIEPVVHAVSGPKRIQPYVWQVGFGSQMYGNDPYRDILTVVEAFTDFSWDGTNVWVNGGYSWCQPKTAPDTGWRLDYCYILENVFSSNSSTGPVSRRDEGQFENIYVCEPGGSFPCYVHQLDNRRLGYWDGGTTCQLWYSGRIVYMAWQRCDVFETPPCGVGGVCFDPVFQI